MSTLPKYKPFLLSLHLYHQGKTRDTFILPNHGDLLLLVTTDRVSTHNVVHQNYIKDKGEILTAMTIFWSQLLDFPHHIVAFGKNIYPYLLPGLKEDYPPGLHKRALVVRKLKMIPIEFVLRSRLAGSLWKEYASNEGENSYGLVLPPGLPFMHRFDQAIFTPTSKSDEDTPLNAHKVTAQYPAEVSFVQSVYAAGGSHIRNCGIDDIDSKFEIGYDQDGQIILADEFLTPDSSRFARASEIEIGREPRGLDKQFLRNEAERIWGDRKRTPLLFDEETSKRTTQLYRESFEAIVGMSLESFQRQQNML